MSGFLTASEIGVMKSDFAELLNSPEATNVTITYKVPVDPEVDPAYGTTDAYTWQTKTKKSRCIQKIVTARDEKILAFGILEIGECVLYLPTKLDLSVDEYSSMIFTIVNVEWVPVPRDRKAFYNYLAYRIGNEQISEVVPCKLKH